MQFRSLGSLLLFACHLSEHIVLSRPSLGIAKESRVTVSETKSCCHGCSHHRAKASPPLSSGSADAKEIETLGRQPPASAQSSPQQNVQLLPTSKGDVGHATHPAEQPIPKQEAPEPSIPKAKISSANPAIPEELSPTKGSHGSQDDHENHNHDHHHDQDHAPKSSDQPPHEVSDQ